MTNPRNEPGKREPVCPGCNQPYVLEPNQLSHCPECHADYSPKGGGRCRGGAYGGCCRTFASDTAADRHRVGPFDPPGRRCLTEAELLAQGWRVTGRGWTNSKPMRSGQAFQPPA